MPIDPTIRRLAADAEVVATMRIVDGILEFFAQRRNIDPVVADIVTPQEMVEEFWRMLKQGRLRLEDDFDDDDSPLRDAGPAGAGPRHRRQPVRGPAAPPRRGARESRDDLAAQGAFLIVSA